MTFKDLTPANWTEPDPVMGAFGRVSPLVGPIGMDGQDWARSFLAVELAALVPGAVRDLFRVAQGAAIYGWFFYPMLHLAEEQLHRVAEAAAREAYELSGGSKTRPVFKETIAWLVDEGLIPVESEPRWSATRELRNMASHPREPAVMPPAQVLRVFQATAADISSLFGADPVDPAAALAALHSGYGDNPRRGQLTADRSSEHWEGAEAAPLVSLVCARRHEVAQEFGIDLSWVRSGLRKPPARSAPPKTYGESCRSTANAYVCPEAGLP